MKQFSALAVLAAVMAVAPAAAQAEQAYASKQVNLRAGPARDFPVVAVLTRGVELNVHGCLSDYSWCDVTTGPYRGWVYAANISYPYQGNNVPVLNYGALIGIGVLGFIVGDYWSDHYRDRSWYSDHQRWSHRSVPLRPGYRPPPPPPGFNGQRPPRPGWSGQRPVPPPHPGAGGRDRLPPPGVGPGNRPSPGGAARPGLRRGNEPGHDY